METADATRTARTQDLRYGYGLRGIPGASLPISFRAVGGNLGYGRIRADRRTCDHAIRRHLDWGTRRATHSERHDRAAGLRAPSHRGAVLVRRRQEPAGGGDGEAFAVAGDVGQGTRVHFSRPRHQTWG